MEINTEKDQRISKGRALINSVLQKKKVEYDAISHFTALLRKRGGMVTRQLMDEATTACIIWQIAYSVIVSLPYPIDLLLAWNTGINDPRQTDYNQMIDLALTIYYFIYSKSSELYTPLLKSKVELCNENHTSNENHTPCMIPFDIDTLDTLSYGNYYACLYIDRDETSDILHYFVIHHGTDNKWFISSSYGSEFVKIPVLTKEITTDTLKQFISDLYDPITNRSKLDVFFKRYFLRDGLPVYFSDEDDVPIRLRGKRMNTQKGIDKEVGAVVNGRSTGVLHLGFINGMEEYVQMEINRRGARGGKRIQKYKKQRKQRTQRKQKKSHKTRRGKKY